MVDLAALLSDEDLRRRFGTPTLDRAWDYVRRGKVLTHSATGWTATATWRSGAWGWLDRGAVLRSVGVGLDGDDLWMYGRCSCPVGDGCKHVVALLITVREEHARQAPSHGRRWEGQLSGLLEEVDERVERGSVARARRWPCRWTCASRRGRTPTAGGRSSRRRGAGHAPPAPAAARGPRQLGAHRDRVDGRALPSTGAATRVPRWPRSTTCSGRTARPPGRCTSVPTSTSRSAPSVPTRWSSSARWSRPACRWSPAGGWGAVDVLDPVTLRLDVNAAEGDDLLRLGVQVGEDWYSAATSTCWAPTGTSWRCGSPRGGTGRSAGDPGHAGDDGGPPAAGPRRRRRRAGRRPRGPRRRLPAPAAPARARFLQRRLRDGARAGRAAAGPRGHLGGGRRGAGRPGRFRYRLGRGRPGLRAVGHPRHAGVRRPEAEQALVDTLVLDEEQVYHRAGRTSAPAGCRTPGPPVTRTRSSSPSTRRRGSASRSRSRRPVSSLPTRSSRVPRSSTSRPARRRRSRAAPTGWTSRWRSPSTTSPSRSRTCSSR